MITVAEEVERAVKLATKHQNLKTNKHQNLKLTFPVNETVDFIALSSDEDEGVQDVNMGAMEVDIVKEKSKVVLPNEKKRTHEKSLNGKPGTDGTFEKIVKLKVRKENELQAARLPDSSEDENLKQLKHVDNTFTVHSPLLSASSSKHQLSESVEEDPQPQPAFTWHHQQSKANASPGPQISVPSSRPLQRPIDTRPPLHCVTPAHEPMLSCSHFDGSIVLCEEVRVKVERPETLDDAQDPLICQSKDRDVSEKGESTDDNEGVNHAVKIKECRVMLQRRILDNSPARPKDSARVVFDNCGKRYLNKWTLMKHTKHAHLGVQHNKIKQKCKIDGCEKPFFHRLGVHMRMMHGQPKLKCGNCDVEFNSKQGLKRHIVSKHGDQ